MNETLKSVLITGVFSLASAFGGAIFTGFFTNQLEQQKHESELVLKALEQCNAKDRLEFLKFLVKTNLLKDDSIKKGIEDYSKGKTTLSFRILGISSSTDCKN